MPRRKNRLVRIGHKRLRELRSRGKKRKEIGGREVGRGVEEGIGHQRRKETENEDIDIAHLHRVGATVQGNDN